MNNKLFEPDGVAHICERLEQVCKDLKIPINEGLALRQRALYELIVWDAAELGVFDKETDEEALEALTGMFDKYTDDALPYVTVPKNFVGDDDEDDDVDFDFAFGNTTRH
jgi:hypothetical protein